MANASELKSKCSNVQSKYSAKQSELTRRYTAWEDSVGIYATRSMQEVSKSWSTGFSCGVSGTSSLAESLVREEGELQQIRSSLHSLSEELMRVVSRADSV